ncbi:putative SMC6, structural maintenance of chromosome protein 6, copy B [Daphnia pulex]|uniref:Putative SMC6, structural maintenance of chromosome protein 6, copy B n=1 Tax=Daphnia pulex TaxID=6669 RepID=E9GJ94_DAPPU|nr:putative SMC6, structural maintenance of chromosome protein 6, copy B [Daphnia pulex]|eukprot:EFX80525.1 putative SMC6, structural maintenance of chromosome protein 6, copy B [Daphnia pulex]
MELINRIENPCSYQISKLVKLRPGAKVGSWCGLVLPLSMIFSCLKDHETVSISYKLASICSTVSLVFLYMNLFNKKPLITHVTALVVALSGCLLTGTALITVMKFMCFMILINIKSYTFLCKLFLHFPCSFSIGEAILAVQGTIVFCFVSISNCVLDGSNLSTAFCQIFLLGIGMFLLGTGLIQKCQQLLPFTLLLFTVMGTVTLPIMLLVMKKNPITWFLIDFIFLDTTRVFLILYWLACTILALAIAWWFGNGSSVKLTVLRKYFHGVVIAIYLPGVFFDTELLFVASVMVLAAFLLLESVRLYNLDYVGDILNKNMAGFLDEKDQGTLILTHIYLLIGCSLPIWIFPLKSAMDTTDKLLLCSGVVSLGIGDTAASIGGTLWGKNKFPGSSKSIEGTVCSILAEILFVIIMFHFGKNGSGKSAVLTGIVVALGERASATCRGQSIKDFVKTGKSKAVVSVTLINKGKGSYKRKIFGDTITIERTINASTGSGGYKIFNEQRKLISDKRSDLNRILAQMNIQVDNPVCILNQETAKNFLHSNDAQQKYKLFERATQMDAMRNEYSVAEDEISRSKACMREKLQSLEILNADLSKWKTKKEWYKAINEIHDKKAKLENEIFWAQVEGFEKKASEALQKKNHQQSEIEKARVKIQEHEQRLVELQEKFQSRKVDAVEKKKELQIAREEFSVVDNQLTGMKNRQGTFQNDLRQLGNEKQRLMKDKAELIAEIDKLNREYGDSEHAKRKERREAELHQLNEKLENLESSRKVSEHQVEQLKNALIQLRNETLAVRSELTRTHNSLGSYIKLRDRTWAPVVEHYFGPRLSCFVCSNDEDAKLLQKIVHEEAPRNGQAPKILVSCTNGQVHDVREHKVHCSEELISKDIHCLMDMLIIEDNEVTNVLIDLNGIEQVLLIGNDRDACYLLSDSSRVPYNCKSAITKEGNTYHPDPNYRSYCGRVGNTARYLQASVEDAIRNLHEEIENLQRDEIRIGQNLKNFSMQIQNNEGQLRNEESKLSSTRREISDGNRKKKTLELENVEGGSTDVLALKEDLADVENKLERIDDDIQTKTDNFEELKREMQKLRQIVNQHQATISSLMADSGPLQDSFRYMETQQRNIKEIIDKLSASLASMQSKLDSFEADYEEARAKAESEAALAAQASSRAPVTKSLKNLNSELRQLEQQIVAQEKELGSRDHVFAEYRRRKVDYERAFSEVTGVQSSLKKMMEMSKKRKDFIRIFRNSIEARTHHIFRALLRTRNFEGELSFDHNEKTLSLMVVPPGRDGSSQPATKRGRESGATDIRSLSGGERSFATVCFILSLWDATESPFRILDEFDVFMDHVNRSICMELLVTEARENSGRQFVFLTPLGLEKQQLNNMDDLSIFRMDDPNRRE